jgi:hypothetical protein
MMNLTIVNIRDKDFVKLVGIHLRAIAEVDAIPLDVVVFTMDGGGAKTFCCSAAAGVQLAKFQGDSWRSAKSLQQLTR